MQQSFQQIGTTIGALVEEKNRAYGSSFSTAGAAMRLLYPNGISPEQMADALVLVRMWDKMMRIATDRDALGESPYGDITGYGILGVAMHQREEAPETCESATSKDVEESLTASATFVAPSVEPRIMPPANDANESSVKQNSKSSSASSSESKEVAFAPTVTADAPSLAGVQGFDDAEQA